MKERVVAQSAGAGSPDKDSCQLVAELTKTESTLLEVWRQVLEREQMGPEDDFFSAGGNSLSAVLVCAEIQERFGLTLSVSDLYQHSNVRKLARAINAFTGQGVANHDQRSNC